MLPLDYIGLALMVAGLNMRALKPDTVAFLAEPGWRWPLAIWPDGRKPEISDGFMSPRPQTADGLHGGVDVMYRRLPSEPATLPRGSKHYYMPPGAQLLAVRGGVVGRASMEKFGGAIQVDHGRGVTSVYYHSATVAVKVGDRVAAGQPLGLVGGAPPGPGVYGLVHLHFELWGATVPTSFKKVDPAPLMKDWSH